MVSTRRKSSRSQTHRTYEAKKRRHPSYAGAPINPEPQKESHSAAAALKISKPKAESAVTVPQPDQPAAVFKQASEEQQSIPAAAVSSSRQPLPEPAAAVGKAADSTAVKDTAENHPITGEQEMSLGQLVFHPLQAIAEEISQPSVDHQKCQFRILVKDMAVAAVFSALIANLLNRNSFSYVRMSFTDASWLFVRITLLELCAGILAVGVIVLMDRRSQQRKTKFADTVNQQSATAMSIAAAFLAAGLIAGGGKIAGTAALAAAFAYAGMLHLSAYESAGHTDRRQTILMAVMILVLSVLLFWLWLYLCAGDMVKIFSDILNF